MLAQYKSALEDAQKSIKLDNKFVKGFIREAKCYLILGDFSSAERSLKNVEYIDCKNEELLKERAQSLTAVRSEEEALRAYEKQDYRTSLFHANRALTVATHCARLKSLKAEVLALMKRYQESQDILNELYKEDPTNADTFYVRGMILYYQDNEEKAFTHFQQALRLCPDHSKARKIFKNAKLLKAKKEEGNALYKDNKLEEAYDTYTHALQLDPLNCITNAKLYFNRALVCAKVIYCFCYYHYHILKKRPTMLTHRFLLILLLQRNELQKAVEDCSNAIKNDENYIKAYLKRAKLLMDMEQFEEAVRDYERIYKKQRTRGINLFHLYN